MALEMQLERKRGNRYSCILFKDRQVMQHTEVRIFHLHRFFETEMSEMLLLKIEIRFS